MQLGAYGVRDALQTKHGKRCETDHPYEFRFLQIGEPRASQQGTHFPTPIVHCVTPTFTSLSYIVIFVKISLQRLNALSIAAAGVMLFLITSAWAWPQSCSESHWPQAGENAL